MKSANEKVLDRIRKLLAMSKDAGSPHEAAIAAGRARKLMDEYQVSELDLTTAGKTDMGTADGDTGMKNRYPAVDNLAIATAKLNDCITEYAIDAWPLVAYRFKGFLVDAVCATEMFKYLLAEMRRQGRAYKGTARDKKHFKRGFASGVHAQVLEILREREQIKTTAGTALVVCKKAMVAEHYGVAQYGKSRTRTRYDHSFAAGYEAGRRTNLTRQVAGNNRKQLR